MRKTLVTVLTAVLVAGCASTGEQNGRLGGAAVGGGFGALIGNALDCKGCALIGGLIGAGIGGYTGGQIGQRMDQQDAMMTSRAINTAPTGTTTTWNNPDQGMRYDVTPVKTYQKTSGQYCREVIIGQAEIGGKRQEVYGTACHQPDGSWKIQQ